MLDFDIQRCTRRCHSSDRELKAGEDFYSVLVSEGADVVRRDYAADAWEGPPEQAIGWWKSQMPSLTSKKIHWAPNDIMLHYFQQLEEHEDKADVRYILSLLMLRRRILQLEESQDDEQGAQWMVLVAAKDDAEHRVRVVEPGPARIQEIQEELAKLLFADGA